MVFLPRHLRSQETPTRENPTEIYPSLHPQKLRRLSLILYASNDHESPIRVPFGARPVGLPGGQEACTPPSPLQLAEMDVNILLSARILLTSVMQC